MSIRVASVSEIPLLGTKVVMVGEERILLCRSGDGSISAVQDRCSHAEVRLSEGSFDGAEVECPAHGARFCVKTGRQLCMPAVVPIPTFPVTVEGDDVFLEGIAA